MEDELNTMMVEIQKIITGRSKHPMAGVTMRLHIMDHDYTIEGIKLLNLDIVRDYEKNLGDVVNATIVLPLGTYRDKIVQCRDNLEATIYTDIMERQLNKPPKHVDMIETRYIAKILNDEVPSMKTDGATYQKTDTTDLNALINIELQLIEKSMEILKFTEVGVIARHVTLKDFILTFLTHELAKMDVSEQIIGIDLIEPENPTVYEQVVIPQGTKLVSIPDYLQKTYGLYNRGISSYVQSRVWYIYPRHDLERKPKEDRQAVIYVVPDGLIPSHDNTVIKDPNTDTWKMLAKGTLHGSNLTNEQKLNHGTGDRFTLATPITTPEHNSVGGNLSNINASVINVEELGKPEKGGEIHAPYKPIFTDNSYPIYSHRSSLMLGSISCVWEKSYPSVIKPGTYVDVVYMNNKGLILELKGIVALINTSTYSYSKGTINYQYQTNSGMIIMVESVIEDKFIGKEVKKTKGGAIGWMGKGTASGYHSLLPMDEYL